MCKQEIKANKGGWWIRWITSKTKDKIRENKSRGGSKQNKNKRQDKRKQNQRVDQIKEKNSGVWATQQQLHVMLNL